MARGKDGKGAPAMLFPGHRRDARPSRAEKAGRRPAVALDDGRASGQAGVHLSPEVAATRQPMHTLGWRSTRRSGFLRDRSVIVLSCEITRGWSIRTGVPTGSKWGVDELEVDVAAGTRRVKDEHAAMSRRRSRVTFHISLPYGSEMRCERERADTSLCRCMYREMRCDLCGLPHAPRGCSNGPEPASSPQPFCCHQPPAKHARAPQMSGRVQVPRLTVTCETRGVPRVPSLTVAAKRTRGPYL